MPFYHKQLTLSNRIPIFGQTKHNYCKFPGPLRPSIHVGPG
ncbi:hypothetical protein HMPREF1545_03747 [Oscillibacter sp. KLE 1728]|nr:hypothetical protein HMPREF1545_03747 [Oscillibacter sp. KLE 1728]